MKRYFKDLGEKKLGERRMRFIKIVSKAFVWLLVLILFVNTFYMVSAGYRGILLTFGKPTMDAVGEGIHFKIPFVQQVQRMEVRTQKIETTADAASKDLQDVQTKIALNYHLSTEEVPVLYQEIGKAYQERIIDPAIQEAVREQLKLKAEWDLERIKIEKEQMITQAEAQAQSLKLQKMEVTEDLIKLREIEMRLKAIEKWNGIMPQVVGGAVPFIDIGMSVQ